MILENKETLFVGGPAHGTFGLSIGFSEWAIVNLQDDNSSHAYQRTLVYAHGKRPRADVVFVMAHSDLGNLDKAWAAIWLTALAFSFVVKGWL